MSEIAAGEIAASKKSDKQKQKDKEKAKKEKEKERQRREKEKEKQKKQKNHDKRKAQATPKGSTPSIKPTQPRPGLKTKPSQTVQAPIPQAKQTARAEPQAGQVKAKHKPVTKVQKRDGSRFSNKYVPAEEKKPAIQTPKENPRFASKYSLDEES